MGATRKAHARGFESNSNYIHTFSKPNISNNEEVPGFRIDL
jgi:hypothetical protein